MIDKEESIINNEAKFRMYTRVLEQWVAVKQIGVAFSSWFEENGFKRIAVYGMGKIGQLFINELMDSGIEVYYGIDKNYTKNDIKLGKVKVNGIDEKWDDVDIVVVTAMAEFESIKCLLREKVDCPIVSLEDIIYELY